MTSRSGVGILSANKPPGSDVGRDSLSKAFAHLGLRAVTVDAEGKTCPSGP
jgi:hypothetical protein